MSGLHLHRSFVVASREGVLGSPFRPSPIVPLIARLPSTMDRPRAVFLLTGIMASGKSTVAQLLAERLPRAAHVRGDAFRRMIVTGRRDMTPARAQRRRSNSHCVTGWPPPPPTPTSGPASPWSSRTSSWAGGSPGSSTSSRVVRCSWWSWPPARRWWRPGKRTDRRPATAPGPQNS